MCMYEVWTKSGWVTECYSVLYSDHVCDVHVTPVKISAEKRTSGEDVVGKTIQDELKEAAATLDKKNGKKKAKKRSSSFDVRLARKQNGTALHLKFLEISRVFLFI